MFEKWHDRVLREARKNHKLVQKLLRIRKLEKQLIGGVNIKGGTVIQTGSILSRVNNKEFQKANQKYNEILDKITASLIEKGENPDEFSQWLSYKYEEILSEL